MASTTEPAPAGTQPATAAQILELAHIYRINLDATSSAGTIGLKEGRETGSSVEIQDFRDYVPGDDPRRIDWLAYGRTDRLVVRLFREEVSPFFDVIVDTSASMGIADGRKRALCTELAHWMYHSAKVQAVPVRIFAAGVELSRLDGPEQVAFGESESVLFVSPARAAAALRRASVRRLLTDFMAPVGPAAVLRALSAGCGTLGVVHVLGPWESDPKLEGPAVLDGVETSRRIDLNLDGRTVESYRSRLRALLAVIRDEMFKCGGLYIGLVADRTLEDVLKNDFLPAGLVETRA